MENQKILIEKKGHIAVLTINSPPANAWSLAAAEEFLAAINDVEADKSVRVIIITGAGEKCFSAGFDLTDVANIETLGGMVQELWRRIDRMEKPVIAAINGVALGGGCELAMACHFRFMADAPKVKIGLTELNLGIIPGWGGTQRMAKIIGKAKALEMILFSEKVTGSEALKIGLVNGISAPERLMEECLEFAQRLAERPPVAVGRVLKAMSAGEYEGIDVGLTVESESAISLRDSKDAAEGITAFLEKRAPVFTGD